VGEVIEAPETYKDVKGLVTADYQKHLEEKWVKSLRKKYKVKVDKDVLKTVNNHD
jgi:peptidyl-prolyl cis-trans isomerase SurA